MSANLPPWLSATPVTPVTAKLPDWLTGSVKRDPTPRTPMGNTPEAKELLFTQFELAFPHVLDRMCGGETMNKAIMSVPWIIDQGAFMRWVKKDAQRYAMFIEAKEVRTEVWAGEMVKHALGGELETTELDRAKFIVSTYKFLIQSDNKRAYGDTKQIEVNQNISIVSALAAAQTRVAQVIDVDLVDEADPVFKQLSAPVNDDNEEEDD